MKKILTLVLGCKDSHYGPIDKAAKETWATICPENMNIIFMYGGGEGKIFWDNKDSFYVDRKESLNICPYKTISAYETFLESDFDYVYRPNGTGYYDLNIVNEFLKDKPTENFYCGIRGDLNGISFASGSSYFLSKDLVKKLVENKSTLYGYDMPGWHDDVIVGRYLQSIGVPINPSARRIDLNPNDIDENLDMSHYHYRILNKGCARSLYKIHELKTNFKK